MIAHKIRLDPTDAPARLFEVWAKGGRSRVAGPVGRPVAPLTEFWRGVPLGAGAVDAAADPGTRLPALDPGSGGRAKPRRLPQADAVAERWFRGS